MDVPSRNEAGPGEGAALLVAGGDGRVARARAMARAVGELDQTLRSTRGRWAIRRLTPVGDERVAPTRVGIKHAMEAIVRQGAEVIVVAIAGAIGGVKGEPVLITGPAWREFPEEATLGLRWIGERMAGVGGWKVIVVSAVAEEGAPPVEAWAEALAGTHGTHGAGSGVGGAGGGARGAGAGGVLVVVEAAEGAAAVDATALAFRGAAVDPETGTVTMRSAGEFLARVVRGACVRGERPGQTIVRPASLDDLRALGWTRPASGEAAGAEDDLTSSVLRGEIRVDEVIARGSFGVVYRARQLWMSRDVALKVLPPGIAARSEEGQLFLDEIRAVGRIDHPHVVRVLHADETYDGRLFFAMELLEGEDLDAIADRGPVAPARAIALTVQLLAGLAAAHEAGLVHADIKPGNAFVARSGEKERVVLLDFGLARLARGGGAASAGGTPQYMAPEQLAHRRIDERSDLFSVGLVLVTLLTGWRRQRASELQPPLAEITDDGLRAVIGKAVAIDPAARYARASELAAALAALPIARDAAASVMPASSSVVVVGGVGRGSEQDPPQPPPFRRLRAFSERDRDRFFGREQEVSQLVDHVLQQGAVIYAAPSGVGKTSLLRAGLLPRLEALGAQGIYVACHAGRNDPTQAITAALRAGSDVALAEAWAAPRPRGAGRRVLVVDQIEVVLAGDDGAMDALAHALLGGAAAERDQAVVLAVREDFLGRLVERLQPYAANVTIVRLPPLSLDGARAALVRPLAARRLAIEDALLAALLDDLTRAAASLGAEMGWGATRAVYPPHLQLAGARLHEALPPDETTLTLAQYRALGGIDEIVRSHLAHVLESELARAQVPIAREVFKHLITPAQTRASPTEAELVAAVGEPPDAIAAVLEALRHHGLVVRFARGDREPSWELVHDSLIPRIQAWMDEHDLARRRAIELLRHHARQSRPGAPSLPSRAELRALRAVPDAVAIVEREWSDRAAAVAAGDAPLWTPARLVARARSLHRRRTLAIGAAIAAATLALAVAAGAWWRGRAAEARRDALIAQNLGRFTIELAPFDWDPATRTARPALIDALPDLRWSLHDPDPRDPDEVGAPMAGVVRRGASLAGATAIRHAIDAPGRAAFLVVGGRGRDGLACAPSIVPIRALPGYRERDAARVLRIAVPTCQASAADTIAIPAGRFRAGGAGEPPSAYVATAEHAAEADVELPAFAIDRTEVTNGAFAQLAGMAAITGIAPVYYPRTDYLARAGEPDRPVSHVAWPTARAYCRYAGKELPTAAQWQRALRGGLVLADGTRNPHPARNLPWGAPIDPPPARLAGGDARGPAPVGSHPRDASPDGVLDLAGNVSEWTDSRPFTDDPAERAALRVLRGGDWENTTAAFLVDMMALENTRTPDTTYYSTGFRCARAR